MGKSYDPATDKLTFHEEFNKFFTVEAQPTGTVDQVKPDYPYTQMYGGIRVTHLDPEGTVLMSGRGVAGGSTLETVVTFPFPLVNDYQPTSTHGQWPGLVYGADDIIVDTLSIASAGFEFVRDSSSLGASYTSYWHVHGVML